MPLRRFVLLALALGAGACKPSIPGNSNPAFLDYAVLDPSASPPSIPTPNDLALLNAATTSGAQGDLLRVFATSGCEANQTWPACGGFPNDQEVPITFELLRVPMKGTPSAPAPDLDPATVSFCPGSGCNLLVMQLAPGTPKALGANDVDVEYTTSGSQGTLAIRNKPQSSPIQGTRRWPAGARFLAALRGGDSGLKTSAGGIQPQPTVFLLIQGKNLADPANQGPLQGTPAEKAAAGQQLETLRQFYASPPQGAPPGTPSTFQLIESTGFPLAELADLTTFNITSAGGTSVVVDESAGVVPLPSDLLLDPATGKVISNPGFCQGHFDQTSPPSCPLSRGLTTVDGFSTTGTVLASLSGPAQAASIDASSVFLFEMTSSGPRRLVDLVRGIGGGGAPEYVTQPPQLVQGGFTTAIGLQPAVHLDAPARLNLPPLKESTEYAVVITKGVKDAGGNPLVRSTVASTLLLPDPLFADGKSQLAGIPDSQAQGLEAMRQGVAAAIGALPNGLGANDVAMAYTFKTQSITQPALALVKIPYAGGLPDAPAAVANLTPAQAEDKYGVPSGLLSTAVVDHVTEATIVTFDLLDPASGAFKADPTTGTAAPIPALVVIPKAAAPSSGAPLVIFRHGITRGRADALLMATALASSGMVVAAIDAVKHGDRAFCSAIHLFQGGQPVFADQCSDSNVCTNVPDIECAAGSSCVPDPALAGQGDTKPSGPGVPTNLPDPWPGACKKPDGSAGALKYQPVVTPSPANWNGTGGIALASGEYGITSNLFRTRDSLRQDIIDQAVLVRALTSAAGQAQLGYAIDPTKVYFVGQSLGAIQGTVDVAVNPNFRKAVLNAGGGTVMDVLITSPRFESQIAALLASLGITNRSSPAFLQFVNVSKWILDPADPINFAQHLVTSPLPNPLDTSSTPAAQQPKAVLGQAARCDNVVPNPTNQLLYGLVGLAPDDPLASAATPSLQWFSSTSDACIPGETTGGAPHGFLLQSTRAQGEVVKFLTGQALDATPLAP